MRFAFFTGEVAITVRHSVFQGPGDEGTESGSRVEVRHYVEDTPEPHNAVTVGRLVEPYWRADLFTHDQGEPGNWERAHEHVEWIGHEPGPRSWDPAMKADPIGYTLSRLEDLPALLRAAGENGVADTVDPREVAALLPAIRAAIETCLKPGGKSQ